MCGILGSFACPAFDVASRLDLIRHRGPDGSGVMTAGPAVHVHVRLSLVDLSHASDQPFCRSGGTLSFTGEIWNYRDVRADLEERGHQFHTTGDTEVLAAALIEWQEAALPKLEGMFAFAWSYRDSHILARDRYGKIPLYVSRRGKSFVWSNERKGLGKEWPAVALPAGSVLDLTEGTVRHWYSLPAASPTNRSIGTLLEDGVAAR